MHPKVTPIDGRLYQFTYRAWNSDEVVMYREGVVVGMNWGGHTKNVFPQLKYKLSEALESGHYYDDTTDLRAMLRELTEVEALTYTLTGGL